MKTNEKWGSLILRLVIGFGIMACGWAKIDPRI
jgi:hypothetical protein